MKIRNLKYQTHSARSCMAALLLALGSPVAFADGPIANGDFNGDGYDDMMVGIPKEDVGVMKDAGAVSVFYGTAAGLAAEPFHQLHQNTPQLGTRAPIHGQAETGDQFGRVLAVGDFNNDGFDDAAIAAPKENNDDGVVHILYGSRQGAHGLRNDLLSMSGFRYPHGLKGSFGAALAVGDVNQDGYDDLAIGIPALDDDAIGVEDTGAFMMVYGSANGLTRNTQLVYERYLKFAGILGESEKSDQFGYSLAMDDFDRDGHVDVAVGIPGEDQGSVKNVGDVAVFYGSKAQGIVGIHAARFQNKQPKDGDGLFLELSTGDFDGNGYPDLAVGYSQQNGPDGQRDSGAVMVIFSTSQGQGLDGSRPQFLTQGLGVGKQEEADWFGASLTAADFNGDGIDDLAVGAPLESKAARFSFLNPSVHSVGHVTAFYGSTDGLKLTDRSDWHQDRPGVAGSRDYRDSFGHVLGRGDYNNDGFADLVVAVPGEDVNMDFIPKQEDAGIVQIIYGESAGLSTAARLGRQVFSEPRRTTGGTNGRAEKGDRFGGEF